MSNTNYAVIVNQDGAVQLINAAGPLGDPGPANTAQSVSVCQDGTIWIVSLQPLESGGNAIMYSKDDGKTFQKPGNLDFGGMRVAGLLDGTCWYLDGDQTLHLLTQAGVQTPIEDAGGILDMVVDIHQTGWIISTNFNPELEGNTIMVRDTNYPTFNKIVGDPIAVRISAWRGSNCIAITPKGELQSVIYDGTVKLITPAGVDVAADVSTSQEGGTIWILTDVRDNEGGRPVAVWQYEEGKEPTWTTIPNVLASSIAGAG